MITALVLLILALYCAMLGLFYYRSMYLMAEKSADYWFRETNKEIGLRFDALGQQNEANQKLSDASRAYNDVVLAMQGLRTALEVQEEE